MITHGRNTTSSTLFFLAMTLHLQAEMQSPDFDGNAEAAQQRVAAAASNWLDDKQGYISQVFNAFGLPVVTESHSNGYFNVRSMYRY